MTQLKSFHYTFPFIHLFAHRSAHLCQMLCWALGI